MAAVASVVQIPGTIIAELVSCIREGHRLSAEAASIMVRMIELSAHDRMRADAATFLEEHDAYSHFEIDAAGVVWQTGGNEWRRVGGCWAMTTGRSDNMLDAICHAAKSLGWTP